MCFRKVIARCRLKCFFFSFIVPNVAPTISAYMSPNTTSVYLNWTEVTSLDLNGIFQGYKVLHRVTEQSANTEYAARVLYGNKTELLLTDLEMYTNYTLRVLAFTLSGDGFISDSVTVMTLDGGTRDAWTQITLIRFQNRQSFYFFAPVFYESCKAVSSILISS